MTGDKPMADWLRATEGRRWTWMDTERVLGHIREVEDSWRKLAQHQIDEIREHNPDEAE